MRNLTACDVHIFDPTPRARAHFDAVVSGAKADKRTPINNAADTFYQLSKDTLAGLHFHALGIWHRNEVQRFYIPANESHVSHSINNLHDTTAYFEAPCRRLDELTALIGEQHVAALKMDIEGAEFAVLRDMIFHSKLRPKLLMIEISCWARTESKKR